MLGLIEDDLWDAFIPSSNGMLWNANINPILSSNGDGNNTQFDFSFLNWIQCLKGLDGRERGSDSPSLTPAAMMGLKQ